MYIENENFTREENAVFALRSLFEGYGFKKYKMSRFEEYELYAQNKSFLESERIITFTDLNGRLMALKPDVTLSIVKNTLAGENVGDVKYHYNEEVFRADSSDREIRKIMQVGVEHIGDIDLYATVETILLAKQSLTLIDENNLLDLSHLGFVSGLLFGVSEAAKPKLLKCIAEKNTHEIFGVCEKYGIDEKRAQALAELSQIYGPVENALESAKKLIINDEMQAAFDELSEIYSIMKNTGYGQNINLDFSIVNDMSYYNGVIFQGYVQNVPTYVLSGGRYDRLIEKMGGKGQKAVGFAVYLDLIGLYDSEGSGNDCDILIIYDEKTNAAKLFETVRAYVQTGRTVLTAKDYGEIRAEDTVDMRGVCE